MNKQKIFLDIDNQIISGDEISWDMWYCDMTIDSGAKELIDVIKAQDIRSNFKKGIGISAKWKNDDDTDWKNCIIMGMIDGILTFRILGFAQKSDEQEYTP